ncbi:MAG: patatin-like phospholipase family protein [Solirubrobacterales bacterium]
MGSGEPKIGLVLGAGGVMGGAWLTGGLHAIARETGWDPASAHTIVGTSAGSMMGGLLAAGVPPWLMVAHSAGRRMKYLLDARGEPVEEADRSGGAVFRVDWGALPRWPASWRLLTDIARNPRRYASTQVGAALSPRGVISTEPLREVIRRAVPAGWAEHPDLRIVACEERTGRRVAFGTPEAPEADLADACAASCAIPGFYRPVQIGGVNYVDGGVRSPSNLELLADGTYDLVICLNPTSSRLRTGPALPRAMRDAAGRRLGVEARRVRATGTRVVLIQPEADDLAAMGSNLMRRRGRHQVVDTAISTVGEQLRRASNAALLDGLPPGEPHRLEQPTGHPSSWPDVGPGRIVA